MSAVVFMNRCSDRQLCASGSLWTHTVHHRFPDTFYILRVLPYNTSSIFGIKESGFLTTHFSNLPYATFMLTQK